jgi:hypothetical protein
MPRAGFETAIPATMRPQTYALDGAATGIGKTMHDGTYNFNYAHHKLDFKKVKCNNL